MMHKKKNSLLKNQEGFTLLEIIAVLVILGILSVVAVPKYFDLQKAAADKAMQAAMAEVIGRVNGFFAQELLDGEAPNEITYLISDTVTNDGLGGSTGNDLGDFTFSIIISPEDSSKLRLTVEPKEESAVAGYYTDEDEDFYRDIPIPGIPEE